MRKLLFALSAAAGIAAAACAQQRQNMYKETSDNRILIAYFSATGTTARAAERLAEATGGTLYAIVPARPYTPDDLDWHDKRSRSSAEMNDPQARPAIGGRQPDTEDYDTVFIGYPIWWGIAAWPVDNFVKGNDFTGKTVIPFCTSSSSGLGDSGNLLEEMAGTGDWQEGHRFSSGASDADAADWVASLNLNE